MMWLVGYRLKALVGSVLAVGALIAGVFLLGRNIEKQKQKVKDLEAYKKTKERIDEADVNTDRDAAIDRLRDNDQLR